jgi:hypothetical protein
VDRFDGKPRKGCDILVQCLEREGVDTVFAYPGGASMEIHQALTRSTTVKNILCRHEQVRHPCHTSIQQHLCRHADMTHVVVASRCCRSCHCLLLRSYLASMPRCGLLWLKMWLCLVLRRSPIRHHICACPEHDHRA